MVSTKTLLLKHYTAVKVICLSIAKAKARKENYFVIVSVRMETTVMLINLEDP